MDPQFIGMVFESVIIVCATIILVLILLKYLEKRHQLVKKFIFSIPIFYKKNIITKKY
jgi:hypothetical protein